MIHSLTVLKKAIYGFNKRAHGADDFWRITRREKIFVDFWMLRKGVKGFYGINNKYKRPVKYIVIDQRLIPDGKWLFTGFHELIHHFLDAPVKNMEVYFSKDHASAREEKTADRFARMLLYPKPLLLQLQDTPFEEIGEEHDLKMLKLRWKDFTLYGE